MTIPQIGPDVPLAAADLAAFIHAFEDLTLPKPHWTHHAHLLVGLWYLSKQSPDQALNTVRKRIRAYNEAVGTANTDEGGYHETLTRFYLEGIAAHMARHAEQPLGVVLQLLLNSPLARSDWPLTCYSRERLFSVQARRHWVEPDLDSRA